MASYNPFNNQGEIGYSEQQNTGLFSRLLRQVSSFGMRYDDMVVKNQIGVGINEDPRSASGSSMYDFFSRRAISTVLDKKSIPYLDKSYADKKRILRRKKRNKKKIKKKSEVKTSNYFFFFLTNKA